MGQANSSFDTSSKTLPPQNLEAEASLLGAILIDSEAIVKIADSINSEDFYDKKHQYIYESILQLYEERSAIDVLTLSDKLSNNGHLELIGGPGLLTDLTNFVPTAAHVEQYAEIVSQKALRRRLIATSKEIIELGQDETKQLRELVEEAESKLFNVSQQHIKQNIISIEAILAESFDRLDDLHKDKDKIRGIPTGFKDLDNTLAGFQRSDLVILAARPSMGKAQPLDSNVLTTGGMKLMADLQVGDQLASIDGQPSKVTGIFPQGIKQVFKITFSDGRTCQATGEHLWRVHYRNWKTPKILTTDKVTEMLKHKAYQHGLWIDMFSGNFGHSDKLPIDPRVMGLLLGEGDFKSLKFSTSSELILDQMTKDAGSDLRINYAGNYDYRIVSTLDHFRPGHSGVWPNLIKQTLKDLGLWTKPSYDKFIPEIYKNGGHLARLELLQGLLDADGWVEKTGSVCYSSASKRLANDVVELARSLGAWASIKTRTNSSYQYTGENNEGLTQYLVNIEYRNRKILFTLPEKINTTLAVFKKTKKPVFMSIEPVRMADTQCIAVSHPSRLYVTDNYVVTHNTALALNFAHNIATKSNQPVLIFSLEMSKEQLVDRLLSMESGVDAWALRTGNLTDSDFEKIGLAMGSLSEAPIYIDDSPGITVSDLRTKARREAHKYPLGLIIVDYLQLMSGHGRFGNEGNRVQEISEISRGLKGIARELNVPLLALSQLSRSVESRSPQIPQLSDLRESGSIEQDADVVAFIYREDYYNPETDRKKLTDIFIKKHRNGPTGGVELYFDNEKQRFRSVDTKHSQPFKD
jgi:replicative DNA helicase